MKNTIALACLCTLLSACEKETVVVMEKRGSVSQRLESISSEIIDDKQTKLQWSKNLSPPDLEWEEARQYCSNLELAGADDWRLPTTAELETTINDSLIDENSGSTERPFHGPFILEIDGIVFSGTPVEGYEDAPWVMRLANAHIYNGKGNTGYARCVRDKRFD